MEYLVKNEELVLKYIPGKGAWTYHIQVPDTKHLVGKWGSLKVSGYIDDYKIDSINLFTITGQDKLISVNDKIRKAINKGGGDKVNVTLYLLTIQAVTEMEILESFKDSGVSDVFDSLPDDEKKVIIGEIISIKSEDKQVEAIVDTINQLSRKSGF